MLIQNEALQTQMTLLSNTDLHLSLQMSIKAERRYTYLVLLHLGEVDLRKSYLEYGTVSLFKYLTKVLGYSEDASYSRQQAARLLQAYPFIFEFLESGEIHLSQLVRLKTA